jgi:Tfp pilus assembly protein PilV
MWRSWTGKLQSDFRAKTRQRGAFLLEAMICVVILSVCQVMVIQSLLSAVHATREAEQLTRATLVGENARCALSFKKVSVGDVATETIYDENDYHVLLRLSQIDSAVADNCLLKADIDVQWKFGNKDRTLDFPTMMMGENGS